MPLQVYTARVSYGGADRLDITRMGNTRLPGQGAILAPSWEILRPAKNAARFAASWAKAGNEARADAILRQAWARYTASYLQEMRESYRARRGDWCRLLQRESVTLVCYCAEERRCHRHLAAELLVACGAESRGERRTIEPEGDAGSR